MQSDILIIGGGLSGLVATWQLNRAGFNTHLLEARNRFGGRIHTIREGGADCDLGPSWFWDGQALIASLLKEFGLSYYEQFSDGAVLFEQADGSIISSPTPSPMTGSRRIVGGIQQLVDSIVNEIDESKRHLQHIVKSVSLENDNVLVEVVNAATTHHMRTKQVVIAMPLRLAAELNYSPNLPTPVMQTLQTTPTWMAGHAKFFAVYDQAFWRTKGLCGTAISRRGPLAEIHDASPQSGDTHALFGFVGMTATNRAHIGREALIDHAIAQLTVLFGAEASQPKAIYLQDWSAEAFTASARDRQAQTQHPHYGITMQLGDSWHEKLAFIVSETAPGNSGLVEGALEAGLRFAQRTANIKTHVSEGNSTPHTASMGWDWLSN